MKNRIWVSAIVLIAIALFSVGNLVAQVSSDSNSKYIKVESYNGSTTPKAFQFSVALSGENLNYANWSLAVSVNGLIRNSESKFLDPSKVKIRINEVLGHGITLGGIGASQEYIPLSNEDRLVIIGSSFPLKTGDHNDNNKRHTFEFDILVEGGNYLEQLKSWQAYDMSLTFAVLRANGKTVLTQSSSNIGMQIYPEGIPPSGPEFGFEVNANASLNFTKPEDYTKQVENAPNSSWLKVTSKNTPYIVRVKTNSSDFSGDKGIIPVNAVSMKVDGPTNSALGAIIPSVSLSPNEQVVFNGKATGTNPHLLDVRYFITKSEAEKLATKQPGQYTTTLTYTLSPP